MHQFTKAYGNHPDAAKLVAPRPLTALNRIHAVHQSGKQLNDQAKRDIFETHFLDGRETVVSPIIEKAVEQFDCQLMKSLALMPVARFAYFPRGHRLQIWQFIRKAEKIARGLTAFDIVALINWKHIEGTLDRYAILRRPFVVDSPGLLSQLKSEFLATA